MAVETLLWPSLIIGFALLLTGRRSEENSRLRNVSGLLMVAAFSTALFSWFAQNGFQLLGIEMALLVSGLALLAGWAFKSRPAAMLSAFATLIYLASLYPEIGLMTGISDQLSQFGSGLIPILILCQVLLAHKLKSIGVLLTSLTAAYLWLVTATDGLPLEPLAGLGFVVCAAHYAFGKARSERGAFGGNLHRLMPWAIALTAALYVQSIWMLEDAGIAKSVWTATRLWWVVLTAAIAVLFLVSLMRYKNSQISLPGVFIVCAAVLIFPIASAKPDLIYSVFDAVPGLDARPGLGLMISAVIIAAGFLLLLKGLKSDQILELSLGALTISIESVMLFRPESFNTDLGVIFVVSLICALCLGGLIAGASDPSRPQLKQYA